MATQDRGSKKRKKSWFAQTGRNQLDGAYSGVVEGKIWVKSIFYIVSSHDSEERQQ